MTLCTCCMMNSGLIKSICNHWFCDQCSKQLYNSNLNCTVCNKINTTKYLNKKFIKYLN